MTAQEFKDAFLAAQPQAVLEGDPAAWISDIQRTDGGERPHHRHRRGHRHRGPGPADLLPALGHL